MTEMGVLQIMLFFFVLLVMVKPLGWYMAQVYTGNVGWLQRLVGPGENLLYRLGRINVTDEMDWQCYLTAFLCANAISFSLVYLLLRAQHLLPFNPQQVSAMPPGAAFNIAVSYVTNTDWQTYPDGALSYATQMFVCTAQNFLSAASGMALLIALCRGVRRQQNKELGNFWLDLTRGVLYILLPLAFLFALFLAAQGVIQNLQPTVTATLLEPQTLAQSESQQAVPPSLPLTQQAIPMGPVASLVAIKQLGSNGGGFFRANAAHPLENPTPLTNFFEMLALLLIPAALCYTYGHLIAQPAQGWLALSAMLLLLLPGVLQTYAHEQSGNPALTHLVAGGNLEGKETRFGVVNSALWTVAAVAAGNGALNSTLAAYLPASSLPLFVLLQLGGGVGAGLVHMLMFILLTVFCASALRGSAPTFAGKKLTAFEMKISISAICLIPCVILVLTALAVTLPMGSHTPAAGSLRLTEILYTFASLTTNNGSAYASLNGADRFYTDGGGAMLVGRYWLAVMTLALAGSFAGKARMPLNSGVMTSTGGWFLVLLLGVILLLGALPLFPALSLGPIAEQLLAWPAYDS